MPKNIDLQVCMWKKNHLRTCQEIDLLILSECKKEEGCKNFSMVLWLMSSLVNAFNKYAFSVCCILDFMQDAGDSVENKNRSGPSLHGMYRIKIELSTPVESNSFPFLKSTELHWQPGSPSGWDKQHISPRSPSFSVLKKIQASSAGDGDLAFGYNKENLLIHFIHTCLPQAFTGN